MGNSIHFTTRIRVRAYRSRFGLMGAVGALERSRNQDEVQLDRVYASNDH